MYSVNKYQKDEIHQLISKGRKQGYLFFEEAKKTFQDDFNDEEGFDGFLRFMNEYGIKLFDKHREILPKRGESGFVSHEELERTTDPVKLYLREMGNTSLLSREEEIEIAKEIERG